MDIERARALVPADPPRVKRSFWRVLRGGLARIPFAKDAIAAYYCALDPKSPLKVKAVLMGALTYLVVPTDLVPDFFAVLGFSDDAAVLYAAISTVVAYITPEHRQRALEKLDQLKAE